MGNFENGPDLDTFFRNFNSGANLDSYFITWAYWEFAFYLFTIQKIYISIQNVKIWRKKECPILPRHFFGKTKNSLKKGKKIFMKYKNPSNMFCFSTRLYPIPFYWIIADIIQIKGVHILPHHKRAVHRNSPTNSTKKMCPAQFQGNEKYQPWLFYNYSNIWVISFY